MRLKTPYRLLLTSLAPLALATPAFANFHLMQIEQVIGGVNGDTTKQAIQLRMRSAGQSVVSQAQIRAFDAAGLQIDAQVDRRTHGRVHRRAGILERKILHILRQDLNAHGGSFAGTVVALGKSFAAHDALARQNRGSRYHGLASADKLTTVLPHKCRIRACFSRLTLRSRCRRCALDRHRARG